MEADLYETGNILFADQHSLKTVNVHDKSVNTIAGSSLEDGYVEGVGTEARFNIIAGFHQLLPTKIIVLDTRNHCIRTLSRTTIQTKLYAGVCTSGGYADGNASLFSSPRSIITDVKDLTTLIVTDRGNRALRTINIKTRVVMTLYKNDASTETYQGMLQENNTGDIYLTFRHGVTKYDYKTKSLSQVTGSSSAGFQDNLFDEIQFYHPKELTLISNDVLIVADSYNHLLRVLNLTSKTGISKCSGHRGHLDGELSTCQLWYPQSLCLINGTIYIGESGAIRTISGKYLHIKASVFSTIQKLVF